MPEHTTPQTEKEWTWQYASRSKIGATCPTCGTIHGSDAVVAVGRFEPGGPLGYRAAKIDGPLRATREEAHRDVCAARVLPPDRKGAAHA